MRALLYWASYVCALPLTLLGVVLYLLGFAIPFRVDSDGVIHWRALGWGIHHLIFDLGFAGAYTMGACVCWPNAMVSGNPRTMAHEKRHVAQMRWWMSAAVGLFLVTYLILAGYSLAKTGNVWEANPLELDAINAE